MRLVCCPASAPRPAHRDVVPLVIQGGGWPQSSIWEHRQQEALYRVATVTRQPVEWAEPRWSLHQLFISNTRASDRDVATNCHLFRPESVCKISASRWMRSRIKCLKCKSRVMQASPTGSVTHAQHQEKPGSLCQQPLVEGGWKYSIGEDAACWVWAINSQQRNTKEEMTTGTVLIMLLREFSWCDNCCCFC